MPIYKGQGVETARNIAKAYKLEMIEGKSRKETAEILGCSTQNAGQLLSNDLMARKMYLASISGELGEDGHKRVYKEVMAEIEANPSLFLSCSAVKKAQKVAAKVKVDKGVALVKSPGLVTDNRKFSFMSEEQSTQWFRSIEAGFNVWLAADVAGVNRELPLQWINAAGSDEECARFLRITRQVSAFAYLELVEKISDGDISWKATAYVLEHFEHFDQKAVGASNSDELRLILEQAMAGTLATPGEVVPTGG